MSPCSSWIARLVALALLLVAVSSCIFTLPFDSLTDGVQRGGPPPTSRYPLDETSGLIANDVVGQNPGKLDTETPNVIPKWIPDGHRGGALDFASDGWVEIPNLSQARYPQRGTLALWLRVRAFSTTAYETSVMELVEANDDAPFSVYITASNVTFERVAPNDVASYSNTPSVALNTWVLIALAWDIPANRALLFVRPDGADPFPIQRGEMPPGFAVKSPDFLVFTENGSIDDVRFYDRMLTDEELAALD